MQGAGFSPEAVPSKKREKKVVNQRARYIWRGRKAEVKVVPMT